MEHDGSRDFATLLRQAVGRRGISLRALQMRLRDRGHEVSVATLSMWSSGARTPSSDAALDAVLELEDLLHLDDGALVSAVRPRRRVAEDRNRTFLEYYGADAESTEEFLAEKSPRELSERSGSIMHFLDRDGRIARTVNRTVFQARKDGAREITVFFAIDKSEVSPPTVRGTIGCELVDVRAKMDAFLVRATLRLVAPLSKGQIVLTERETAQRVYGDDEPDTQVGVFAPRRQAELGLHVWFDPDQLPRSCRVDVETDAGRRSFPLLLSGAVASHVEFDFGPGEIEIFWEW